MKYKSPEKRMRKHNEKLPQVKQKWVEFRIVVPDQDTKEQLQAACEYLHCRDINTDYVAVNALVHAYLGPEDGGVAFVVDPNLFKKLKNASMTTGTRPVACE